MSSLDWKKNIEDSMKYRLIITVTMDRNILNSKGSKHKTTKDAPRYHGYHETCWWNSRWCPFQGLCSLQKMDQRVIQQQKFYSPIKGNKITWRQMQIHPKGCRVLLTHVYAALLFNR